MFALATGIAPFIFGVAYDRFQDYQQVLVVVAAMSAVGAMLLLGLGRYPQTPDGRHASAGRD